MPPSFHRIPRHPHAWLPCLLLSQLLVAAVWWRYGWHLGLPAMLASHAPFWLATLVPDAALFSPVLRALPTRERVLWLTIDDGPSAETPAVLELLDRH